MKKVFFGIIIAIIALVGAIFTVSCIEMIPVGRVATVYSPSKGIKDDLLQSGWHLVSPMYKTKEFSVSNEQLILSKDDREGSEDDESFNVATADDASIGLSFQMSYRFIEKDVVKTFKAYKGLDGEDIVNKYVKTVLKSEISEVTTDYSMMDIYSGNRAEINTKITEHLDKEFQKKYGIEVTDASIIDVHLSKSLKASVDQRVKALQEKQQAKAEQEKVKVEAETKKIKAENEAEVKLIKSKANADAKLVAAEAEAKANKMLSESITKELIDMKVAEARMEHGWVEIQGSDTTVVKKK